MIGFLFLKILGQENHKDLKREKNLFLHIISERKFFLQLQNKLLDQQSTNSETFTNPIKNMYEKNTCIASICRGLQVCSYTIAVPYSLFSNYM